MEQLQNIPPPILLARMFLKNDTLCKNKLTQVTGYSAVKLGHFKSDNENIIFLSN